MEQHCRVLLRLGVLTATLSASALATVGPVTPIPEPSTMLMVGLGGIALAIVLRRRNRR